MTTVTVQGNKTTVVPGTRSISVVTTGVQGPVGANGTNGSGQVIDSEVAPTSPTNGQMWIKTSTGVLAVYSSGTWEPIVYKTELAASTGDLDANGGYF